MKSDLAADWELVERAGTANVGPRLVRGIGMHSKVDPDSETVLLEPSRSDHPGPRSGAESTSELLETPQAPRTIVVAIDASDGATRVLSTAIRLARSLPSAVLHVVHVFRTARYHAHVGVPATPAEVIEEAKAHLDSHVRDAQRQRRAQVVGRFAVGDPVVEVSRLCAQVKADLLVIGTHDRSGLERLLLGSIAETLVRKAPCSVFVVRPSDAR